MTSFKLIDRGFKETILLIPGWASDYRIFDPLELNFNYLMPVMFSPFDFEPALLASFKENSFKEVSILGWSMGGFLAADFAAKYPQHVKNLTLIGMRKRYDVADTDKIKGYIETNKNGYLYKFYHECFSAEEKEELARFKKGLMKDYLKDIATEDLLDGLDYLKKAELNLETLRKVRTRLIHGESDRIAPVDGMLNIKKEAPWMDLIILKGTGHMPFLSSGFKKALYE